MSDQVDEDIAWWDMHTPAAFVSSFPDWVEQQLVVVVPTPCRTAPGIASAIERRFAEDGAWLTKRYQEDLDETEDPADVLLSYFSIDVTSIDILQGLVAGLRDTVVLVKTGSWSRWERFTLSFTRRARRREFGPEHALPRFILFTPKEAVDRDFDRWCIRTLPQIKPQDVEMFIALHERDRSTSSLEHDLRVQLIKHVSGPDPTLASFLQRQPTETLTSPWQYLALLGSERIGYDVEPGVDKEYPFEDPSWDSGLLSIVDGREVLSGVGIAANDKTGQQQFRIWCAALHVFLPFCYIEAQRFREAYRSLLIAPWPRDFRDPTPHNHKRHFDTIKNVENLELPQIANQMTTSRIFDSGLPSYLLDLSKLRNQIAHYDAIDDRLMLAVLKQEQQHRVLPVLRPEVVSQGRRNLEIAASAYFQSCKFDS